MAKTNSIIRRVMVTEYKAHDDDGNNYEGDINGAYMPHELQSKFEQMHSPLIVDHVEYHIKQYKMDIDTFVKYATPIESR